MGVGIGLSVPYRAASQARTQAQGKTQVLRMRAIVTRAALAEAQQQTASERAETNSDDDP